MKLEILNPHWKKNYLYNFPKKRFIFNKILKYINERFIIAITGIRRTGKNRLTSEKKLKRAYISATSFLFLNEFFDISKVIENFFVSNFFNAKFFWRNAYKHEVDIILDNNIPVEIKFKDNIYEKNIKNMFIFMKKFNISTGIVIQNQP